MTKGNCDTRRGRRVEIIEGQGLYAAVDSGTKDIVAVALTKEDIKKICSRRSHKIVTGA